MGKAAESVDGLGPWLARNTDIESIEKQDIRRRYAGKQAPRESRKKLTATVAVGGREIVGLESKHNEKERLQVEKAARNAMKGKKGKAKAEEPTKQRHIPPHPFQILLTAHRCLRVAEGIQFGWARPMI